MLPMNIFYRRGVCSNKSFDQNNSIEDRVDHISLALLLKSILKRNLNPTTINVNAEVKAWQQKLVHNRVIPYY
jgi:hypothetical protein|tara:strand:- start:31 stop:249 length:219 start_codon:yes stop_codon:yes gene_type:complete